MRYYLNVQFWGQMVNISFWVPSKIALLQGPLHGIPRRQMPRSSSPHSFIFQCPRYKMPPISKSRFHSFVKGSYGQRCPYPENFLTYYPGSPGKEQPPFPRGAHHGASSDLHGLIFKDFQQNALWRVPFEKLKFKTNLSSALNHYHAIRWQAKIEVHIHAHINHGIDSSNHRMKIQSSPRHVWMQ